MSKKNFKQGLVNFLLAKMKINIFILFVLPIINAIFNSYFFSKYIGLTIKSLMANDFPTTQDAIFKIVGVLILLQLLRYIQRISLSKFLTAINFHIKETSFNYFTSLTFNHNKDVKEKVSRLADEIVETINTVYSYIYMPMCKIIMGIITMMFLNKTLGKIFFVFSICFGILLIFTVKKPMANIINLQVVQRDNHMFITDISNNFFLEKILSLRNFTKNLFTNRLNKESDLVEKKYNSLAVSGLYANLSCEVTLSVMLVIVLYMSLPTNIKITSITLMDRFFSEFNDIPDRTIPLLNNIGRIIESMTIFDEEIEVVKDVYMESIKNIRINNISFNYKNKEIIKNFSNELKKGLYILKGKSGSGKTTLLHLIAGIKNIKEGEILINDSCITNKSILNQISYLCQFDYTYNRTVKENLAMSKNIDNIAKDISNYKMMDIIDNNCGNMGENISGGQNKRVAFLRMLNFHKINFHKKGNMIILDEPFNGLDEELINLIVDFIKENMKTSIILMIDHTNYIENLKSIPYEFIRV